MVHLHELLYFLPLPFSSKMLLQLVSVVLPSLIMKMKIFEHVNDQSLKQFYLFDIQGSYDCLKSLNVLEFKCCVFKV